MKYRFLFLIAFCATAFTAFAQESSIIEEIDNNLLKKYVDLARKNYPRIRGFKAREAQAKNQVDIARMSWFDIINVGYYYRPESARANGGGDIGGVVTRDGQIVTSGFMIGATLNLGNILSKPSVVKAAKEAHNASIAESEEYDITLLSEVRSRYYDFLAAKKQLAIRNLSALSLKGLATDAQQKYERGEITIDVYTSSKNAATESEALALTAEVAYLKAKNTLEDIIGSTIESVK